MHVFFRYVLWLNDTAKASERTNRNLPARNTPVQLLALYTNPESYNLQPESYDWLSQRQLSFLLDKEMICYH